MGNGPFSSRRGADDGVSPAQHSHANRSFAEIVDDLATHYILTMDFQSLTQLKDPKYCNDLVVLTSELFDKHFSTHDVPYLARRVAQGVAVDEMTHAPIRYMTRKKFNAYVGEQGAAVAADKQRMCNGLAKFYVKVAHVFAAILATVNPVYTYKDAEGLPHRVALSERDQIPQNVSRQVVHLSLCDNRVRALKRGTLDQLDPDTWTRGQHATVTLQPKVCDFYKANDPTLAEEPGIPELEQLYHDDKYDYATGEFHGMSDETAVSYRQDLEAFYKAFTGQDALPEHVRRFHDVKLRQYGVAACSQAQSLLAQRKPVEVLQTNELYVKYATHLRTMMHTATENQRKLLDVLNDLFAYVDVAPPDSPHLVVTQIRINPALTETTLQHAVQKARQLIVRLYVQCEEDYLEGVRLFEAIVEQTAADTTERQIQALQRQTDQTVERLRAQLPAQPPANSHPPHPPHLVQPPHPYRHRRRHPQHQHQHTNRKKSLVVHKRAPTVKTKAPTVVNPHAPTNNPHAPTVKPKAPSRAPSAIANPPPMYTALEANRVVDDVHTSAFEENDYRAKLNAKRRAQYRRQALTRKQALATNKQTPDPGLVSPAALRRTVRNTVRAIEALP